MNYEVFWEASSLIEKLTFVYMDALKKALKAIVWAGSLVSWKKAWLPGREITLNLSNLAWSLFYVSVLVGKY